MRRAFLALATVFYIVPAAAQVQDELARACDLAAADPYDFARPAGIPGVNMQEINAEAALTACENAFAADPENPRLLLELGRAWQAHKDDSQARVFYEKAAAQGYASAQANLALFYAAGRGGLPKNDEEAARLYKLAADKGDPNGQLGLGTFYETGRGGLPKDEREAARLCNLAVDKGSGDAQARLGGLDAAGRGGLPKDEPEAARSCKLAVDTDPLPSARKANGNPSPAELDWVDAFRTSIQKCWYPPIGTVGKAEFYVELRIWLNPDGSLSQKPSVVKATPSPPVPLSAAYIDSTVQAVQRAQPFTMLKAQNYKQWKVIDLDFDSRLFLAGVPSQAAQKTGLVSGDQNAMPGKKPGIAHQNVRSR